MKGMQIKGSACKYKQYKQTPNYKPKQTNTIKSKQMQANVSESKRMQVERSRKYQIDTDNSMQIQGNASKTLCLDALFFFRVPERGAKKKQCAHCFF